MAAEHSRSEYITSLALHQSQRSHPLPANLPDSPDRHHKARLRPSVISDQRFEQTYLNKIKPCIHVYRVDESGPASSKKGKGKEQSEELVETGEVVTVEWGKIIWITTRDQLIGPFLQGALWSVLCLSVPLYFVVLTELATKGNCDDLHCSSSGLYQSDCAQLVATVQEPPIRPGWQGHRLAT